MSIETRMEIMRTKISLRTLLAFQNKVPPMTNKGV